MARYAGSNDLRRLSLSRIGDGRDGFRGHAKTFEIVVSGHVVRDQPEGRRKCDWLAESPLGLGSYPTAWTWLHKLRRAMVRPGRDRLCGEVEIDETFVGGTEEAVHGRETEKKALVVIAVEKRGKHGFGRVRMARIPDASSDSLLRFMGPSIEPGSLVCTDGWLGYSGVKAQGYRQGHRPERSRKGRGFARIAARASYRRIDRAMAARNPSGTCGTSALGLLPR
jgi:hypothetical protein